MAGNQCRWRAAETGVVRTGSGGIERPQIRVLDFDPKSGWIQQSERAEPQAAIRPMRAIVGLRVDRGPAAGLPQDAIPGGALPLCKRLTHVQPEARWSRRTAEVGQGPRLNLRHAPRWIHGHGETEVVRIGACGRSPA